MFSEEELVTIYGQFMKDVEYFEEDENPEELSIIAKIRQSLGEDHTAVQEWDKGF